MLKVQLKKAMTERQFYAALRKLAIHYGGRREEGEPNIEFTVVDRRTHERLHYEPMPYTHKPGPGAAFDEQLRLANMNLQIAAERLDLTIKLRRYDLTNLT